MSAPVTRPAAAAPSATLGEFALIAAITARLGSSDAVLLGPGDDAAVVAAPGRPGGRDHRRARRGPALQARLVQRRPTSGAGRPPPTSPTSPRWAPCPRRCSSGSPCPPTCPSQWVLELADGLGEEAARAGAAVAGGDLVRGDARHHLGHRARHPRGPRARSPAAGARPGDLVAVAGRLGWAAAGFAVLSRGFRSPADAGRRAPPARSRRTTRGRGPPASAPPRWSTSATAWSATSGHVAAGQRRRDPARDRRLPRAAGVRRHRRGPSTPTRCSGCSPAARTTRWPRPSRRTSTCRWRGA